MIRDDDDKHKADSPDDLSYSEESGGLIFKNTSQNFMADILKGNYILKESFEEWIRLEFRRRQRRSTLFPQEILGEPCWDILLDLASAALDARLISVSSACFASGVPQTTALRWLQLLERHDLVSRSPHPGDGRRINVSITETGMAALRAYHDKYVGL